MSLWREGWMLRDLAEKYGRTIGTMGGAIAWLRHEGYDLPKRPQSKHRGGLRARFERKVERRPGGCWEWTGAKNDVGYGQLFHDGRMEYAHRISLSLADRQVPPGLFVDHLCRNPGCVNPDHLEAVTHGENVRRGRATRLTPREVRDIRASTLSRPELAKAYGVNPSQITRIRLGQAWRGA